ncbi:MAG: MBL fold metallo-hydrolase [Burkholderiales bacterium]
MLRFTNLGSGSAGNATVVEARCGTQVSRVLIDCGLNLKALDSRLARAGLAPDQIDAVFVTHEHADHIGSARAFALRGRIAVWMSHGTHTAIGAPDFEGLLHIARNGVPIDLGALLLEPFTVPHDAREPLQLRCSDGAVRLGVLTDLGHATPRVASALAGCAALLIECNHDPDMLAASRYPAFLKRRVGGLYGHLANTVGAEIARAVASGGRLGQVVAAHLSAQNNHPDLARQALSMALGCSPADVGVADATLGSDWRTV